MTPTRIPLPSSHATVAIYNAGTIVFEIDVAHAINRHRRPPRLDLTFSAWEWNQLNARVQAALAQSKHCLRCGVRLPHHLPKCPLEDSEGLEEEGPEDREDQEVAAMSSLVATGDEG